MADDKTPDQQISDTEANGFNSVVPTKATFGQRLKAHYKKWWWVHVIVLIIVVLVVVLPVYEYTFSPSEHRNYQDGNGVANTRNRVYVGYPHIARHDVNESTLNITQMIITNPASDSFDLNQTQVIGSDSSYHPWFYEFNATVSLAGTSIPFAYIPVPRVKSKNGAKVVINDRVQLVNVSAFDDFCKAVMLNEEVSLNIYGNPDLKQGSLPKTNVEYNKTSTMTGKSTTTTLFPSFKYRRTLIM